MFYDLFAKLCKDKGVAPTKAATDMGFSTSTATKWAKGSMPSGKAMQKIAEYFSVTVDSLLDSEPRFYQIVNALCKERRTTITRMCEDIGLSNAIATAWRKGAVPKPDSISRIADYFGVTSDYLLGVEGTKKAPTLEGERVVTEGMWEIIDALDAADEATQTVVRRLLGLP